MGIFSSSRKVYVSSSIYNMTEPESGERVSFIREALTSTILSGGPNRYLGESIVDSHIKGPRTSQRSFFRWAKDNYDLALPRASIDYSANIDNSELEALIHSSDFNSDPNVTVAVSISFLDSADEGFYAERYILENKPELIHVNWAADYNFTDNKIWIQYPEGTEYPAGTPLINDSFNVPGFNTNKQVIVAYYQSVEETQEATSEQTVETSEVPNAPIITTASLVEVSGTGQPNSTVTVTVAGSASTESVDGSGNWSKTGSFVSNDTVTAVINYNGEVSEAASTTIEGAVPTSDQAASGSETSTDTSEETETVVENETTTVIDTTTTITTSVVTDQYLITTTVTTDIDVITSITDGRTRIFIYEIGSGNSILDGSKVEVSGDPNSREFYPFIPIRIDNNSVFENGSPAITHEQVITKAYKRGVGGDIEELITEIDSNENIEDIDYTYVVFGVCLNTDDKFGKRYVYEFIKTLSDYQQTSNTEYENFLNNFDGRSAPKQNNLRLTLPSSDLGQLDISISWSNIKSSTKTGLAYSGAKVGDVYVGDGSEVTSAVDFQIIGRNFSVTSGLKNVVIRKQLSTNNYEEIICSGLSHKNTIYEGKDVTITGSEALADSDDSGFFLPLHEPTLKRMRLVDSTEVARNSFLLLFNSYQVVKKKWYQKGIFKVFIVIAVIVAVVVISVVTGGTGTPGALAASGGILGSSLGIGVALGFSGILALAVGTAVNVIAAMIVIQLITTVGVEVLGEKLGQIIAIVASVALSLGSGPGGFNTGNISGNLASMASMDKLLLLTNSVSEIAAIIQQDAIQGIYEDLEKITEQHNEEIDRLKQEWEALGFGDRVIDPIMLTQFSSLVSDNFGSDFTIPFSFAESPDAFIARTLMTSSEMIEISQALIDDFVDVSLTLS